MYWSKNADSEGMCDGPADMDDFEMKYDSLEEQEKDEGSIYQYYKKAVKIRNQNPEIARGSIQYLMDISDNNFCVLKKTWNDSEIILIFHTGAETETIDVSGLTVNGETLSEKSIRALLESGEERISMNGTQVTMPGYSVIALK